MSEAATLIDPGTPAPAAALPSVAVAVDPAAAAAPSPTVADPASPGAAAFAPDADWRRVLAGDDTDALKALERYATPGDYHKSFTEAQKTIRAKQEGMIKLPGENGHRRGARGLPEGARHSCGAGQVRAHRAARGP
jgi:hypothetical protein